MQSYGNYPYYGPQPPYQPQPHYMGPGPSNPFPSNPYPAFNYPQNPQAGNPYGPPPHHETREPPFVPPPPGGATPRPKAHRRTVTTPAASAFLPLKSAMKKTATGPPGAEGLTRQSTYPAMYPTTQQNPRPRLYSGVKPPQFNDLNQDFRPRSSILSCFIITAK